MVPYIVIMMITLFLGLSVWMRYILEFDIFFIAISAVMKLQNSVEDGVWVISIFKEWSVYLVTRRLLFDLQRFGCIWDFALKAIWRGPLLEVTFTSQKITYGSIFNGFKFVLKKHIMSKTQLTTHWSIGWRVCFVMSRPKIDNVAWEIKWVRKGSPF